MPESEIYSSAPPKSGSNIVPQKQYASRMLTVQDICNIMHCSEDTVRGKLFSRPDFPIIDICKTTMVEEQAFWQYMARGVRTIDYL